MALAALQPTIVSASVLELAEEKSVCGRNLDLLGLGQKTFSSVLTVLCHHSVGQ